MELNAQIPEGPVDEKWERHLEHIKLVGPNNRPKYDVIVVGTGLAGASAGSSRCWRFCSSSIRITATSQSRRVKCRP